MNKTIKVEKKLKWIPLPDRGPRGSLQNFDRIRLLSTSKGARLGKAGWEVLIDA